MSAIEYYDQGVSYYRFNIAEKLANDYIHEILTTEGELSSIRYKHNPTVENSIGSNVYFRELFFSSKNKNFEIKRASLGLFTEGWKDITDKDGEHQKLLQTVKEIFKYIIDSYKKIIQV